MADPRVNRLHVIYHDACLDGLGAAAAALRANPTAVFLPALTSKAPPPFPPGVPVLVCDIAWDPETTRAMRDRAGSLTVIDHHPGAIERLSEGDGDVLVLDERHSGAVLTWRHFFPDETPEFLLRIEDQDLWRWNLPDNEAFIAGLQAEPMEIPHWAEMIGDRGAVSRLIEAGHVVLRYEAQLVDEILGEGVFAVRMGDLRVPAVPAPRKVRNQVCVALLDKYPNAPLAASWQDLPGGERKWSLRSEDDRKSARAVAEGFSGGGHRNAAAFREQATEPVVRFEGVF